MTMPNQVFECVHDVAALFKLSERSVRSWKGEGALRNFRNGREFPVAVKGRAAFRNAHAMQPVR